MAGATWFWFPLLRRMPDGSGSLPGADWWAKRSSPDRRTRPRGRSWHQGSRLEARALTPAIYVGRDPIEVSTRSGPTSSPWWPRCAPQLAGGESSALLLRPVRCRGRALPPLRSGESVLREGVLGIGPQAERSESRTPLQSHAEGPPCSRPTSAPVPNPSTRAKARRHASGFRLSLQWRDWAGGKRGDWRRARLHDP